MANILEYLDFRGDLALAASPFGEVDAMILSQLAYLPFDGIVPRTGAVPFCAAAKGWSERYGKGEEKKNERWLMLVSLLSRAAKTKRFGGLRIGFYETRWEERTQTQFCAVSFFSESGEAYLCFRGTDDSLVGWKENFNMSFLHPVPAQESARAYTETVAAETAGPLVLCGHSKGGNLSHYAAVTCSYEVGARIARAYSFDGPGFPPAFLSTQAYGEAASRLDTFVPQGSVVGLLFEETAHYEVVISDGVGLLRHDGFSWQVLGDRFLRAQSVGEGSLRVDRALSTLLSSMSTEEREAFVEALYEAVRSTGAQSLSELSRDKLSLLGIWTRLPAASRAVIVRALGLLIKGEKG